MSDYSIPEIEQDIGPASLGSARLKFVLVPFFRY